MAINETDIKGLKELIQATLRIADRAMPVLEATSKELADLVCERARSHAPVLTGKLKAGLTVKPLKTRKDTYRTGYKITLGAGTAYGVPVELGHRIRIRGWTVGTVTARPFLRPAADESKDEVADRMVETMNRELEKWGD